MFPMPRALEHDHDTSVHPPRESLWLKLWKTWTTIIIIVLLLAATALVYLLRDKAHRSGRTGCQGTAARIVGL